MCQVQKPIFAYDVCIPYLISLFRIFYHLRMFNISIDFIDFTFLLFYLIDVAIQSWEIYFENMKRCISCRYSNAPWTFIMVIISDQYLLNMTFTSQSEKFSSFYTFYDTIPKMKIFNVVFHEHRLKFICLHSYSSI